MARPASSFVSSTSALPSGDSATPASVKGWTLSAKSATVHRCSSAFMRRTRCCSICSGVSMPLPPGPSGPPGPRMIIRIPPPMPPRFCTSSQATVPSKAETRSMVGPPLMPAMAISSLRRSLSGRTSRSVMVPSMSRCPIDRRNGPSAVSAFSAASLSPPSAFFTSRDDLRHPILRPCQSRRE